jgi:hypothetical protein
MNLSRSLALACLLSLASSPAAASATDAEELVHALYFEGIPPERGRSLDEAAGNRLARMLADPAEAAHHANIVQALGLCGCGPAYEALRDFAGRPRSGEIDRAELRAWSAVPNAMAHLADRDPRALAWLSAEAQAPRPLAVHHRHHSGKRLAAERHWAAIAALGLVGNDKADAILAALERRAPAQDAALARRLGAARELCARVAQHGRSALRGSNR